MTRRLALPLILIVVLAVGALVSTLVVGNEPELGLDLQGGASVVLQPPDGVEGGDDVLDQAIEVIRNRVDALGVAEPEIQRQGNAIVVQLPGVDNRERAIEIVGQTAELRFRPVLGFASTGEEQVPPISVPPLDEDPVPTEDPNATDPDANPDEGSTPPPEEGSTPSPDDGSTPPTDEGSTTTTEGEALDLRGAEPVAARQETTTTTLPPEGAPPAEAPPEGAPPAEGEEGEPTTTTLVGQVPEEPTTTTSLPEGATPREEDVAEDVVVLPGILEDDQEGEPPLYQLGPAALRGDAVAGARAVAPTGLGASWTVSLTLTEEAIDSFNALAAQCFGGEPLACPPTGIDQDTGTPRGQVAIVLDGIVQSAPVIAAPEFDRDQINIFGAFDEGEAKDLALVLRYGALPVQLERQSTSTVSPSLGRDSLRAGLLAGLIGTLLVLVYMVLYYRALGIVVLLGLGVWFSLQWSIISFLGSTQGLALSLAGVTGIIVSIGVTVDSYIVYFERLKDEIRSGRTVRSSVDRGFKRAFRTILIADTSAFIGAATLYFLTVGPVRGFAFFLGLSTLLDVVVAYFFTRPLVALLGRRQFFTTAPFLGIARGLGVRQPTRLGSPA